MRRFYLLILAVIGIAAVASGHMLYAEFPEEIPANSDVNVWITYGHPQGEKTVPDLSVADVVSPNGDESNLDLNKYEDGLRGTIDIDEPGCYILNLQMKPTFFDPEWYDTNGDVILLPKYGRSLIVAESGDGYDWSKGDGLEIVPISNPHALRTDDQFQAKVFWNGEPVDGDYNAVLVKKPDDLLTVQHEQKCNVEGNSYNGEIDFELPKPGLWVITFNAKIDKSGTWTAISDDPKGHYHESDKLKYDQIMPTAFLSFWCS
ncbi:MAG: DUF4198 domain-containing protein [Methanotrichaceae archaeon]